MDEPSLRQLLRHRRPRKEKAQDYYTKEYGGALLQRG